jgi:short-subunit dehydrogenase
VELGSKTALVTGATGGLGRVIAAALAEKGATLVLSSRKADDLGELADSLPGKGHRPIVADLAEEGAALHVIDEAGPVDILVANAGLPASGRLESFTQEQLGRALRINLESPMRMARELVPPMVERGSGHLVFMSSIAGQAATARASVYAATKFGLRGFAFCLRDDLRKTGVGVSVISPGLIREAGMYAESGAPPPPGVGMGKPEQVAAAVVKAIERNRGEITVAPLRQRALARIAINAPEFSGRVASGLAARVGDRVARGQTHKR